MPFGFNGLYICQVGRLLAVEFCVYLNIDTKSRQGGQVHCCREFVNPGICIFVIICDALHQDVSILESVNPG
jgi:hypothetical protein